MASSSFSLYLFLSLVYLLLCLPHNVSCGEDPMVKMHEQWMTDFNKVYETETEKESRLKIFSENVEYINEFNKAKNRTYTLAINQFTDLTNAEFVALVGRAKLHYEGSKPSVNLTDTVPPPDSVDWRDKGAVTPVKNQKTCGSCWAFAPVAAIESLVQIKTQQLISLSEQEILDCVLHAHSNCTDGYAYDSFNFVASNGGLTTEDDYLYTGTQMSCNSDKLSHKAASITTHDNVPYNDEYQLMLRVAQQPVVAAVTSAGLQHYGSGVLTGDCGTAVDHAVTLVGYGQSEYGPKYWIAKNSWGTTWGDQGYVYLAKDITTMGGTCALATNPTFPIY